jgi:phospholipase D1/2
MDTPVVAPPLPQLDTISPSAKTLSPDTEPEEFPFTASPGEVGVSPTNHLMNGRDPATHPKNTLDSIEDGHANGGNSHTNGNRDVRSTSLIPSVSAEINPSPSAHTRKRSVQFASADAFTESQASARRGSLPQPQTDDSELQPGPSKGEGYGARIISKLKTLSVPLSVHRDHHHDNPDDSDRELPSALHDDHAEESAPELGFSQSSMRQIVRRRLSTKDERRRHTTMDFDSLPPSPPSTRFHLHRTSSDYPSGEIPNLPPSLGASGGRSPSSPAVPFARPRIATRNRTMSEIPEAHRGMSEDEGRSVRSRVKPKHRRRLSRMTSDFLHLDRTESSPAGELGSHVSTTQRLKQLKAKGASLIPFKRDGKKKSVPQAKDAHSIELINSLAAGTRPALMIVASQQRDSHGNKRLPIIFELLRYRIVDAIPGGGHHSKSDHRKLDFVIELQYGEKDRQMKWRIQKSWNELFELHTALASRGRLNNIRKREHLTLPRFPKEVVPYLRGWRGLLQDASERAHGADAGNIDSFGQTEDPAQHTAGTNTPVDETADEGISPMGRPSPRHRQSTFQRLTRTASAFAPETLNRLRKELRSSDVGSGTATDGQRRRELYAQQARDGIEKYMQSLFQVVLRGGDANRHNRLCRFLELSNIGIRLIPEITMKGKEGYLWVKSINSVNFKENLKNLFHLYGPPRKWFFVRSSYIACVEVPNSTELSDVFLFDPSFRIETKETRKLQGSEEAAEADYLADDENDIEQQAATAPDESDKDLIRKGTHQLKIVNSERIVKLLSTKRAIKQFSDSLFVAMSTSIWAKPHRFKSFAPVRPNSWAMPLIDAEEYMWKISVAVEKAKQTIFIHDWWLSPEIYLRRPAATSQEWRLDRVLKRKADEGVKIYIILYRNVESAFNLASERTKELLSRASPNIFIQRSPHAGEQKNFLWAHHEKVLVVDYLTAFCGGIDLCFGRWDNGEHRLADNTLTGFEPGDYPRNQDYCQLWPGKDYNNPRVNDFERVEWPYEELYDRSKVPRMPWHDIGIQLAGHTARDLSRHFIQRWNYLRRRPGGEGRHEKPRPVLLPCPEFTDRELRKLKLTGTCDIQVLRSAGDWSLGLGNLERSVQDAYLASIKESEHFIYIENQFFITARPDLGILNEIGDALVERAIRAHENGEPWKAVIMIPLLPGFAFQPKDWGATSLRMILDDQFFSICRDKRSIYGRLEEKGIRGEDYIQFFSLRQWGEIDARGTLVTEQLYIHAKIMVVDDRTVIIGSANINDRSMLGKRDSEIAVIVQDKAMIPGEMAGAPYEKGELAYNFRMRLMSEHLGIDYTSTQGMEHPFTHKRRTKGGITDQDILSLCPELAGLDFCAPTTSAISDPFAESFNQTWYPTAANNTSLFRLVFHCQPDSPVLTPDQYAVHEEAATLFAECQHGTERPVMKRKPQDGSPAPKILLREEALHILGKVQGHLVEWPRDWLKLTDWRKLADRIAPTQMFS